MSDESDQHPSLREHLGLRERVTVIEGAQANIIQALNRIEARQLTTQAPHPQETARELALHNAADALRTALQQPKGGNAHPALLFLSGIGLLAMGASAAWFVLH